MGLVDRFVEETGPTGAGCDPTKVMDYYDGNTVTALWNYAQHFSMSDNSFGTTFGPSHVGAVNLVSGNNHGADPQRSRAPQSSTERRSATSSQPTTTARRTRSTSTYTGKNIGDLLNQHHVSWGFFSDGFKPTSRLAGRDAGLQRDPHQQVRRDRHRVRQWQRALPVLQVDLQPTPSPSDVSGGDRPPGSGQPPVRPDRFLGRSGRRQPAVGLLPEGRRLPAGRRR